MQDMNRIVLLSTREIRTIGHLLHDVERSWIVSGKFCRYFLEGKDTYNLKEEILKKLKIGKYSEVVEQFLAEHGINQEVKRSLIPSKLRAIDARLEEKYNELSRIDYDFLATKIRELGENVEYETSLNIDGVKEHLIENRFSLFQLRSDSEDSTRDCAVYAVWPLNVSAKNNGKEWLDAISDEILKRHPDADELYLILHDRDLYKTTFRVEWCGEDYETADDNKNCKRYVALFQHANGDPIMKILSQYQKPQKVVSDIIRLFNLEYLCNISEQVGSTNPNKDELYKALKEYNNFNISIGAPAINIGNLEDKSSWDTLETVKMINEELTKILQQLNEERTDGPNA